MSDAERIEALRERLRSHADAAYRDFQGALLPSVPRDCMIGVRTPVLRAIAKEIAGSADADALLHSLPHVYFEENQLHAFLIEQERDFTRCLALLDAFLPYVDNWATCDQMMPRVLARHAEALLPHTERWLTSSHPYTVRYGIGVLMKLFLDDRFSPALLARVASIRSQEYYVNMMLTWYFATALAKQYRATVPYLEQRRLCPWVHQKTIQKAVESDRIPPQTKQYLRTLR